MCCPHLRASDSLLFVKSDVFRKIAASEDAKGKDNNAKELNEVEFLRFLTTQDRTMTRDQVRLSPSFAFVAEGVRCV